MSTQDFAENRIQINEISASSMIRKQFYHGMEDQEKLMVQFTTGSDAVVFNLTEQKPYNIENVVQID